MRRYHRWLAPVFAILFVWIAVTGLTIQFITLSTPSRPGGEQDKEASRALLIPAARAHEHESHRAPAPMPTATAPAAQVLATTPAPPPPETEVDRIRRERHDLSEFVMDLHSGKVLGPLGTWLSILSGFVLIFLAASGLWMYFQMFAARDRNRASRPGSRFFW